jgi:hypothetical protein
MDESPILLSPSSFEFDPYWNDPQLYNRCTELLGLFWTLSIVLYVEDKKSHNVSETGSVSVRWMGQDKPTQLGPLERASLSHWIQSPKRCGIFCLPHTRRWIKSETSPIALYNINHRQNPFKSIFIIGIT